MGKNAETPGQGPGFLAFHVLGEEDSNPQCLDQNQMCYLLHHPRRVPEGRRSVSEDAPSADPREPVVHPAITENPTQGHRCGFSHELAQR